MPRLRTALTDRLVIDVPVVQAPMSEAATPALVAAVSNAGALGMLSGTWRPPADLRRAIREVRSLSSRPFGVNLGVAWPQEERIDACLEDGIRILSLFWGDASGAIERVHAGGAIAVVTVGSTEEAKRAVDAGADVIVAQGWEAGGHADSQIGNLVLVPSVVDVAGEVPVVAAGGIADGRGLAAVLALGAAGAWVGTRFLLTHEAGAHPRYTQRLLAASASDTVVSTTFDVGWPDAPHRTLRNDTVQLWEDSGRAPMGKRPREGEVIGRYPDGRPIVRYAVGFPRPDAEGDIDAMALYAGQGVGMIGDLRSAASVVDALVREAEEAMGALASRIHPADPSERDGETTIR